MSRLFFERTRFKLRCSAKMKKIKPELISDPDIYIFFEKGTIGGTSYVCNRYSKGNNKYLKSYDPKQESKQIIYLDANNLYGYSMSEFLPTSGFKWIDTKEFYSDYSLAPDKIETKREMLSEYHLKIADLCNIPIGILKLILILISLILILKNQCLTFLIKKSMWFIMKTCNFT